jgi:16S rRNA (cytosine967-C5)-methyltransferase
MSSPTARSVALHAIGRVIDDGAYSNRLLPVLLSRSGMDVRDRAFAMELTYGTLRTRLRLDAAITEAAHRPIDRITPPEARHALRLGAYQLLVMDVPAHAAVSATVDLVPGRARGLVNAVLRRLATAAPPEPTGAGPDAIAERTGLAPWAVEELGRVLGDEREAAAAALAAPAPLCLRVVGGPAQVPVVVELLEGAGVSVTPAEVHPACVVVRSGGDPRSLPGFEDGRWTVQDQASTFVGSVLAPGAGDRVYDACAAPGGKTLHAAELVGAGGHVVAADVSTHRVALIARSAARLRVRPWIVTQDATVPAVRGPFARVLVDAPCSGIGSARRRPELLWRVEKERLSALAARQLAIATAGADLTQPGGRFVYAVCTFTRAETDAVCDALLRARPWLTPVLTPGPDGPAERHRLWPHRHGCDGMFVAAFARAS